jgi:hypothetical protein
MPARHKRRVSVHQDTHTHALGHTCVLLTQSGPLHEHIVVHKTLTPCL